MSFLLPLSSKVSVDWKYNSKVFNPKEYNVKGDLTLYFLTNFPGVKTVHVGLRGIVNTHLNYIKINKGIISNEIHTLFDVKKEIPIPHDTDGTYTFKKRASVNVDFDFDFPHDSYLPSTCNRYGYESDQMPMIDVTYELYIEFNKTGSILKKAKTEFITNELLYQGAPFVKSSFESGSYSLLKVFSKSASFDKKILKIGGGNARDIDLTVTLTAPDFIDFCQPLLQQLHFSISTKSIHESYEINGESTGLGKFEIKSLEVIFNNKTSFDLKSKNLKYLYKKSKKIGQFNFSDALFDLKDFELENDKLVISLQHLDQVNRFSIADLLGFKAVLTTGEIEDILQNLTTMEFRYTIDDTVYHFVTSATPAYISAPAV